MSQGFSAISEFHVRADRQREFERRCGPDGDNALRYPTLDRECQGLTERAAPLGEFGGLRG